MTATDTVFAGSIPAIYDQYMVPLVFAPLCEAGCRAGGGTTAAAHP